MGIREERQEEAVKAYLNSDRRTIINACPRFGKIRVAIEIMKRMNIDHVWILAPRNDIFKGWDDDFEKFGYRPTIVGETTFTSIKKIDTKLRPEFIIIDEPHEMSINQQVALAEKLGDISYLILGLTGTLTNKTKNELYDNLNLDTCYTYPISQGVEEGILVDYQMFIHQVPLDTSFKEWGVKKRYTEKKWFDLADYLKGESDNPKTKHMMNLRMINTIQNSMAKAMKTIDLLSEFTGERVLVFCGVTEVADNLGIPVYHSKAREKDIFLDFCVGAGTVNQLATIKMMQAGITITPINKGIINYMSGNPEDSAQKICRFLGLEYSNPGKKAEIHIVSTNEDFELSRLRTGLVFFDPAKITYK